MYFKNTYLFNEVFYSYLLSQCCSDNFYFLVCLCFYFVLFLFLSFFVFYLSFISVQHIVAAVCKKCNTNKVSLLTFSALLTGQKNDMENYLSHSNSSAFFVSCKARTPASLADIRSQ